jgi:hypothetical protein
VIFDTPDEQYLLRADRFAREFALRAIMRGSGHEYRRLDAVRATARTIIVPLQFPSPPDLSSPDRRHDTTLESLMHWDLAPENPVRLVRGGVSIAFCTTFGRTFVALSGEGSHPIKHLKHSHWLPHAFSKSTVNLERLSPASERS